MTIVSINVFFRPVLFLLAFIYSALTAWINGYTTAKLMKFFGASDWFFAAISSAVCFPIYIFTILIAVDCIEYAMKSSSSTPPLTVLVLCILWMCIAVPINFQGAYVAFK